MSSENPYQSPHDNRRPHDSLPGHGQSIGIVRLAVIGAVGGILFGATTGAAAFGFLTPAVAIGRSGIQEQMSHVAGEMWLLVAITDGVILGGIGGTVIGGTLGLATGLTHWLLGPHVAPAVKVCLGVMWVVSGAVIGYASVDPAFATPGITRLLWSCMGALICAGACAAAERLLNRALTRLTQTPTRDKNGSSSPQTTAGPRTRT